MSEKRGASKGKKTQKEEDKRALESGSSKKAAPVEIHEYQCNGDFVEDFRQLLRSIGLPPEEAPRLINKPNYSLWQNIELLPVPVGPQLSESPSPDMLRATKAGGATKVEPSSKSSLMETNMKASKDKGSSKDKGKKKVSKITGKTDQVPAKTSEKISPGSDGLSRGGSSLETNAGRKTGERLVTTKGGREPKDSSRARDDGAGIPDAIQVIEGTDLKPVHVVYEPFTQNRLKEIALRCWTIDRHTLEVLLKCWMVSDKLTTIILVDCGLKTTDIIQLADVLPMIVNLEFLALDGNFITEQNHGIVLSKSTSLRSLSLRYANLDDSAMQNLARSWRLVAREWSADRPGLEFLDLSRNKITDRGLEYLIQALRFNRSLTTLALPGNQITDYGIDLLCNCLFTRFLLTGDELLERRMKKLQFIPPVLNPAIYNLKRRYRHTVTWNREKSRPEKEDKKKDKDDKKASSTRLSGGRISVGNVAKSVAPGSRGIGSAKPDRSSPSSTTQKQGTSVPKSSSQKLAAPGAASHVHLDRDDTDSKSDHRVKEAAARTKGPDIVVPTYTDGLRVGTVEDGDSMASGSYNALPVKLSLTDYQTTQKGIPRLTSQPIEPVTSMSSTEGLYSDTAGPVDPRVADLLTSLRKFNHADTALSDYDLWLDRTVQQWRDSQTNLGYGICPSEFRENMKEHKGLYANTDMTASEYQLVLLQYCQRIVKGTANILALSPQIQDDLVRLCQNPYFMFESENAIPSQPTKVAEEAVPAVEIGGPKFQLHITAASLTGLEEPLLSVSDSSAKLETAAKSDITESVRDLAGEMLPVQTIRLISPEVEFPTATAAVKPPVLEVATATPLSTGLNRSSAKSATPGHRRVSLKKTKSKRGEVDVLTADPPKECPFFSVLTSEEKFDALVDGVLFRENDRLVSDGNRTLKVLNIMSNKITAKGVYRLMETINKQREEQSTATSWERPASPEIVMPRPPSVALNSALDSPESETSITKKEPVAVVNRLEERQTATKRSSSKRPPTDVDSVAATLNVEDNSGDECSPVAVRVRTVKDREDPNRQNFGLSYVDIEHNKDLSANDSAFKVFSKFMLLQRESYGVGGKPSLEELHHVDTGDLLSTSTAAVTEEEKVVAKLKKMPSTDPSHYSLLKSQYMLQKKAALQ